MRCCPYSEDMCETKDLFECMKKPCEVQSYVRDIESKAKKVHEDVHAPTHQSS